MVSLRVPLTFLPKMSMPKLELGDADDPMSQWVFGQAMEIFQCKFQGSVATQSGWVSVITRPALEGLYKDQARAVQWDALRESAEDAGGVLVGATPQQPFLFMGQILEAASAHVYSSNHGQELTGVLISTGEE